MFKKIALVTLFIGVTIGMAFLLYRFFFADTAPSGPAPSETPTVPGGGLPTAGEGVPTTPVVTGPDGLPVAPATPTAPTVPTAPTIGEAEPIGVPGTVASVPTVTGAGLTYYNVGDDRFYRVDGRGDAVRLSERSFPSVTAATWSDAGDKAVLEFPDGSKIVYDFTAETQVTVPKHWEDFDFSSDGATIVGKSIGLDPANRWLISFAADGSSTRLIEPLGENADKVTVSVSPDASIVAFSDTGDPVGFDTRDLLPIGQNQENLAALRVEGFDFTPQWSPAGSRLLYSTAAAVDDYLPSLWVVRADGTSVGAGRTKIAVRTWADKCTFSGESALYCAAPRELPAGAGLQRDIADGTPDRLLRIDLTTGSARDITPRGFDASVKAMTISEDGTEAFVIDGSGAVVRVPLF
jgi:hypothetical protein